METLARLRRGEAVDEAALTASLRSPHCPAALVDLVILTQWPRASRRVARLLVCHPACPRTFTWDILPSLGWHDLMEVARSVRTPPAVRRQAERKLLQRLPKLTVGERTALARAAPRTVIEPLLGSADPACIRALLDNPRFGETDAVRLVNENGSAACVLEVIRHRRWGRSREVTRAALRHAALPLPVAMGLMASAAAVELSALAGSEGTPPALRSAAAELLRHRSGREGGG